MCPADNISERFSMWSGATIQEVKARSDYANAIARLEAEERNQFGQERVASVRQYGEQGLLVNAWQRLNISAQKYWAQAGIARLFREAYYRDFAREWFNIRRDVADDLREKKEEMCLLIRGAMRSFSATIMDVSKGGYQPAAARAIKLFRELPSDAVVRNSEAETQRMGYDLNQERAQYSEQERRLAANSNVQNAESGEGRRKFAAQRAILETELASALAIDKSASSAASGLGSGASTMTGGSPPLAGV